MRSTPFGALLANVLSVGTRGLGVFLFWALRIIYRPRERVIAIGVAAAIAVLIALLVWIF
jgi:hypothetical protein